MKETVVKYPFLSGDVKIYEQDNGHKIVLAYKQGGMVNVSSWVKTGSINENDKNNGISHYFDVGNMGIEHALLPEQGIVTCAEISDKNLSSPKKNSGSVKIERQSAPAASYSLAMSR